MVWDQPDSDNTTTNRSPKSDSKGDNDDIDILSANLHPSVFTVPFDFNRYFESHVESQFNSALGKATNFTRRSTRLASTANPACSLTESVNKRHSSSDSPVVSSSNALPEDELVSSESRDSNSDGEHKCNLCGKCFTFKTNLTAHKKRHLGETSCPYCHKVLSTMGNLRSHIYSAHNVIARPQKTYHLSGAYSKKWAYSPLDYNSS